MGSDTPYPEPFYGSEKEKCISCGKETPYTINTHIDLRDHYIEGAGQLCTGCFEEIYEKKK
jgi:hypothetical protein